MATVTTMGYLFYSSVLNARIIEVVHGFGAAIASGSCVYAVPGSPSVLEQSVVALRGDARIHTEVVPGLSFLDLAWERLGIDPVNATNVTITHCYIHSGDDQVAIKAGGRRSPPARPPPQRGRQRSPTRELRSSRPSGPGSSIFSRTPVCI